VTTPLASQSPPDSPSPAVAPPIAHGAGAPLPTAGATAPSPAAAPPAAPLAFTFRGVTYELPGQLLQHPAAYATDAFHYLARIHGRMPTADEVTAWAETAAGAGWVLWRQLHPRYPRVSIALATAMAVAMGYPEA